MSAAIDQAREVTLQLEPARANGMTALMHAVCDDSVEVVRAMLDCGADVNAKRNDGFTALTLAAFFGRTRIVELLLERGADIRAVTRFGTSPEMWAKARGFHEIVDLLQNTPGTVITSGEHGSAIPNEEGAVTLDEELFLDAAEEKSSLAGPPLTAPRTLPEIHDPPALIAPAFHPGQAFLTRISSDNRSLIALSVALMVTLGLAIFATYQVRSLLRDDAKQTASRDHGLVGEPHAAVAQPDEPQSAPKESVSNQELGSNQAVTVDLPNKASSGSSEKSASPATMVKPSIKNLSTPGLSHSSVSTVRRAAVIRSEQPKQVTEPEIESKPAPLTVEVSGDRNSNPARPTRTVDPSTPQSGPLGITSSKSRTKVIQWP